MSAQTPKTCHMACSVCILGAGRWQQHSNRDTGYGICRSCADWVSNPKQRGRHVCSPMEMANLYGLPGIHYEPHTYSLHGRAFAIVAEYPDTEQGTKDANAFMEAYPVTGLLAAAEGRLIIAALADNGVPA